MADNNRYGRALRRPSDAAGAKSSVSQHRNTREQNNAHARANNTARNVSGAFTGGTNTSRNVRISPTRAANVTHASPSRSVNRVASPAPRTAARSTQSRSGSTEVQPGTRSADAPRRTSGAQNVSSGRARASLNGQMRTSSQPGTRRAARTSFNRYREKVNRPSAPVSYGRETAITARDERKIRRLEKKELRQIEAEREWQSDVERVRGGIDKVMVVIILVLLALGALIIYSASYPAGITKKQNGYYFFTRHIITLILGFVAMFVVSFIPAGFYKKGMGFVGYIITAVCLGIAGFKGRNGEGVANVGRWIYIGSFGFQPSELMKIALVLVLAWYLDRYQNELKSGRTLDEKIDIIVEGKRGGFLRRLSRAFGLGSGSFWRTYRYNTIYPLLIVGVSCLLVLFGRHLSGMVIVGCIGFAMILVAGCHPLYAISTTLAAGIPVIAVYLSLNKYALDRVLTFTAENPDVLSDKWQLSQGILAIGSGGLFGVGYTGSRQKYGYLPEAYNDFIFSIWCEEFGFVGAFLLIALFVVFIWRGYLIAMRAPDKYSSMVAFGITTQVALQAIFNMCVACGVIPTTGISLPFISAGGSSLVILMAEMGILLSISRRYYRKTA